MAFGRSLNRNLARFLPPAKCLPGNSKMFGCRPNIYFHGNEIYAFCVDLSRNVYIFVSCCQPYYRKSDGLDQGTYVRLGHSTVQANADMIEELKWQFRGRAFDMMPVYHAKEEDMDKTKILEFIRTRKSSKVMKKCTFILLK